MDTDKLWASFLESIKNELSPIAFDTWFSESKLVELNNGCAKVVVPMHIHKKNLKEHYNSFIEEKFSEITGSNFKIEYFTEEEIETNIEVKTDELGVPSISSFESNLIAKYNFDTFIVGDSNKFAHATALAVAENPGTMYNPLFIYSNSGLGKTHLMHSIGNYIVKNSKKRVLYVTCDDFINDFTHISRHNKKNAKASNFDNINNFKDKYRNVDVLIIDDIQYLSNAIQTQQEFFNTFNELYQNNKQIIISSDRSPDDLKLLEDRLKTRFNWGLTTSMAPPDFNLRMQIINNKIIGHNLTNEFPEEVKEYIANNCTSDIRKLEGSITRVIAFAAMMNGGIITLDLAMEALKGSFKVQISSKNKIEQVINVVASHYNISVADITSKKRQANIAIPRQVAMYICRVHFDEPLSKIGLAFGGKRHTTVMHSVDKIAKEIKKDVELEKAINKITKDINV
jgi:chromosomal replication initiator protein